MLWQDEPNHVEFEAHGLNCVLHRGPFGHWCGYVSVPKGHPLHGVAYHDESDSLQVALERRMNQPIGDNPSVPVMLGVLCGELHPRPDTVIEIHGGLTFSNSFAPGRDKQSDEWWFGFDCAHAGDLCPREYERGGILGDGVYRDVDYVMLETKHLAQQLAELLSTVAEEA